MDTPLTPGGVSPVRRADCKGRGVPRLRVWVMFAADSSRGSEDSTPAFIPTRDTDTDSVHERPRPIFNRIKPGVEAAGRTTKDNAPTEFPAAGTPGRSATDSPAAGTPGRTRANPDPTCGNLASLAGRGQWPPWARRDSRSTAAF